MHYQTFQKVKYQNSESCQNNLSETSLTHNCSMGFICFRLDLNLASVTVGDCGKVGSKNYVMEFPNGGTRNGTYDAVILDKVERPRAVRS